MRYRLILALLVLGFLSTHSFAADRSGFAVNVLVDDAARTEYVHGGSVYVEAVRGASYSLRITNPTAYRVAVALSVDGLNTIDAKHTDARSASKWVLEPYESTVISGWQVSNRAARNAVQGAPDTNIVSMPGKVLDQAPLAPSAEILPPSDRCRGERPDLFVAVAPRFLHDFGTVVSAGAAHGQREVAADCTDLETFGSNTCDHETLIGGLREVPLLDERAGRRALVLDVHRFAAALVEQRVRAITQVFQGKMLG